MFNFSWESFVLQLRYAHKSNVIIRIMYNYFRWTLFLLGLYTFRFDPQEVDRYCEISDRCHEYFRRFPGIPRKLMHLTIIILSLIGYTGKGVGGKTVKGRKQPILAVVIFVKRKLPMEQIEEV